MNGRGRSLAPGLTYLNTASLGPNTEADIDRAVRALRTELAA
jgi:hypothetical protein